jgi:hypothetical protein
MTLPLSSVILGRATLPLDLIERQDFSAAENPLEIGDRYLFFSHRGSFVDQSIFAICAAKRVEARV